MKKTLLPLLLLLGSCSLLLAQGKIEGSVQERRPTGTMLKPSLEYKVLAGVTIYAENSNSTLSNGQGKFSLNFQGLGAGEPVGLFSLKKVGFEVWEGSKTALGQVVIPIDKKTRPYAFFMYDVVLRQRIEEAFRTSVEQNIAHLRREVLKNKDLTQTIEQLNAKIEQWKNTSVESLTERLYSDISDLERRALEAMRRNKFDEAARILNIDLLLGNAEAAKANMERSQAIAQRAEETYAHTITALLTAANLAELQARFADAERVYKRAWGMDSTRTDKKFNLKVQKGYAAFLSNRYRHQEAMVVLRQALRFSTTDEQKAGFFLQLGAEAHDQNQASPALEAYEEAEQLYRTLAKVNPDRFRADLAMTLNNFGNLLNGQGKAEEAGLKYGEAEELYRILFSLNPDRFRADLAMTLNNFGNLLRDQGKAEEAGLKYGEAEELYRILFSLNPDRFRADLAGTLNNFGVLLSDQGKAEEAGLKYGEAEELRRILFSLNPDRFRADLASTLNNFGVLLRDQGKAEEAESKYYESAKLYRKAAQRGLGKNSYEFAIVLKNLASLKFQQWLQSFEPGLQEEMKRWLEEAKALLVRYPKDFVPAQNLLEEVSGLLRLAELTSAEGKALQKWREAQPFMDANKTETNPAQKVVNQKAALAALKEAQKQAPQTTLFNWVEDISHAYGSLAWYQLFVRDFVAAEAAAREGLRIDPNQAWIYTNLALALLYQGKFEEAKALYLRLKDQHIDDQRLFKEAFLQDFKELEAAGLHHPDVAKIRALLAP